jgi:hypothetical protein
MAQASQFRFLPLPIANRRPADRRRIGKASLKWGGLEKRSLTGERGFESVSLQRRVCELSVPKRQGTLSLGEWANELHPKPEGFRKIAQKFLGPLAEKFPGRAAMQPVVAAAPQEAAIASATAG